MALQVERLRVVVEVECSMTSDQQSVSILDLGGSYSLRKPHLVGHCSGTFRLRAKNTKFSCYGSQYLYYRKAALPYPWSTPKIRCREAPSQVPGLGCFDTEAGRIIYNAITKVARPSGAGFRLLHRRVRWVL